MTLVFVLLTPLSAWSVVPARAADGGPGSAGSSGDAISTLPPVAPAQPVGAVPGIDVSHHQDAIDWAQVAASGQRFAMAKATEGQTFVDPMYAANKIGAETYGMAFGAYHFARPDDTPDDAVLEADHFVDTAQLEPGNLIPALDIERTGGLTQDEMTTWILTWLGRVTERLGVRPMVYTSPNGWLVRTGDTTAVAAAGYAVLWVAHWNVSEPRLPASDWGGNGWTFWQYGNCGSVPGIAGCVDVDWYETSSFDPVLIPSPDVTPPVASIALPADVLGTTTVSFSEVVHRVTPENTFIWSAETGTYPDVSLTCRSGSGVEVDCVTGNVRTAVVRPVQPLVVGERYQAVVDPAIVPVAVVDRSGNPVPTTTVDFAAPTEVEQTSPAVADAWRTVSKARALGGSLAIEHRAGASASFAFSGRSITWFTATGPEQGRASVLVDGHRVGTFDQYAPGPGFRVPREVTGLERGPHVLTIRVLGTASASATDTQVVVDAFEAGGAVVKNPALDEAWGNVRYPRASGGSVSSTDLAGSSAVIAFRGTGVIWTTVRGRDQGRAQIWVDGLLVRTIDNYGPSRTFGVARAVSGLTDGVHTLRIVVLGESRPAATAALVTIDRFAAIA